MSVAVIVVGSSLYLRNYPNMDLFVIPKKHLSEEKFIDPVNNLCEELVCSKVRKLPHHARIIRYSSEKEKFLEKLTKRGEVTGRVLTC